MEEAIYLVKQGIKEVILVAQDTTQDGKDLYGSIQLVKLLKELVKIEDLRWIRLLYCYPNNFSDELIHVIKTEPKICKYVDLPLQHADNMILKRMGRNITQEEIINLVTKLRTQIPEIIIRSTFIVGFPGETKENFENLIKFFQQIRLDQLGAFLYSRKYTPAAKMPGQIKLATKDA